jgi:hypothetical protein
MSFGIILSFCKASWAQLVDVLEGTLIGLLASGTIADGETHRDSGLSLEWHPFFGRGDERVRPGREYDMSADCQQDVVNVSWADLLDHM